MMFRAKSLKLCASTTMLLASLLAATPQVQAATAIRSQEITEAEFQSLASALGHRTVADVTADIVLEGAQDLAGEAAMEELTRAQEKWLALQNNSTAAAVRDFEQAADAYLARLNLSEAETAEQRHTSLTLLLRLVQVTHGTEQAARMEKMNSHFAPASIESVRASDFPGVEAKTIELWKTSYAASKKKWSRVKPSDVADDVVAVAINGAVYTRRDLIVSELPSGTAKVTVFSNTHAPKSATVELPGFENALRGRSLLADGVCSTATPAVPPSLVGEVVLLGKDLCQQTLVRAASANQKTIARAEDPELKSFGLTSKSGFDADLPFGMNAAEKPVYQKPWFWGVVAAVAIGAAVVIDRQKQKDGEIVAVHHENF